MADIQLKPIYIDGENIGAPGSKTYKEYWERRYNEAGSGKEYSDLWELEYDAIKYAYQDDITKAYPGDGLYGEKYNAHRVFLEEGLLSEHSQNKYNFSGYSEANPSGRIPSQYTDGDQINFLEYKAPKVRPKPKMMEKPKTFTGDDGVFEYDEEQKKALEENEVIDGGELPQVNISEEKEKDNEQNFLEKERDQAPRIKKGNIQRSSVENNNSSGQNLNNNNDSNVGFEINPNTGAVIVPDNDTNQYRSISTDSSNVIATEPFPTPGPDGNLPKYENESDEDYEKRNSTYINSLTSKQRVDMQYNNYLSTVYSPLDGPADMSADLIGRNEDNDGKDDWDRAWDQMANKEGILSKKEWYELNRW